MYAHMFLQMAVRQAFAGRRLLSTGTHPVYPVHFPYDKSDFLSIHRSEQFFDDFSGYIREVEMMGEHLIFTRPPCWGKSLFQNMIRFYYDKNTAGEEFHDLFGDLQICKEDKKQPTPFAC